MYQGSLVGQTLTWGVWPVRLVSKPVKPNSYLHYKALDSRVYNCAYAIIIWGCSFIQNNVGEGPE